jgi:hypothetical protein
MSIPSYQVKKNRKGKIAFEEREQKYREYNREHKLMRKKNIQKERKDIAYIIDD